MFLCQTALDLGKTCPRPPRTVQDVHKICLRQLRTYTSQPETYPGHAKTAHNLPTSYSRHPDTYQRLAKESARPAQDSPRQSKTAQDLHKTVPDLPKVPPNSAGLKIIVGERGRVQDTPRLARNLSTPYARHLDTYQRLAKERFPLVKRG